jgi:hypothetical protein
MITEKTLKELLILTQKLLLRLRDESLDNQFRDILLKIVEETDESSISRSH